MGKRLLQARELARELWVDGYDSTTVMTALEDIGVTDAEEQAEVVYWFSQWSVIISNMQREFGAMDFIPTPLTNDHRKEYKMIDIKKLQSLGFSIQDLTVTYQKIVGTVSTSIFADETYEDVRQTIYDINKYWSEFNDKLNVMLETLKEVQNNARDN